MDSLSGDDYFRMKVLIDIILIIKKLVKIVGIRDTHFNMANKHSSYCIG